MILFFQQLVNGLLLGSTYSLVAIGYTLILGTLNLLHFAHGEVFMMGAFFGLLAVLFWNVNFYVSIVIGMVGAALVGILVDLFAVRPSGRISTWRLSSRPSASPSFCRRRRIIFQAASR